MKRILPWAAALWMAIAASNVFAQQTSPAGTLVIIGGALRVDNSEVWTRIVKHAAEAKQAAASPESPGSYRPKIAVFPTASGDPQKSGRTAAETLQSYGADAFVVPVAKTSMEIAPEVAVHDPELVEQVKNADGVYFTGGQQSRIIETLYTADGSRTPMLEAIWHVYSRGGVVAGTSAGAAVMSRVMYRDAKRILNTLQDGVSMGKELDRGLGFLDPAWFVEQHTLVRGRFARALVAMKTNDIKYGVGVDENTAIVVRNDDMEVVGYKGAIVMDISEAEEDPTIDGFNVKNVKLTYLDEGDKLRLSTREVIPSPTKQQGKKIDPRAPDYQPEDNEPIFTTDVLGNTTAVDLMCRLVKNEHGEAVGLAFDGRAVREEGATRGFEFRFYRGDDTLGWCTHARGDETYTVQNIRLDIRPVQIVGPLYR